MAKEKPTTKICKYCQTEIPYEAKVCPQCRKKQRGKKLPLIIGIVVVLLIVMAVAGSGSGGSSTAQKVGEVQGASAVENQEPQETAEAEETGETEDTEQTEAAQPETTEEPEQQTAFRVGDVLETSDLRITYVSSGVYVSDNQFSQPDEGMQYIFLTFYGENISDSDASITEFSFECYADGYACDSYYGGDDELSATLSPGRGTTGSVYFQVPVDAETVEVEYEVNMITEEKVTFLYEGDQDSGFAVEANTQASEDAFQVGDIIETSDLIITYLSCDEFVSDNAYLQPKDGYHYIYCEFEFENISDSDQYVGYFDFDCFADGQSCDGCYQMDDNLSATISPGRKATGTVAFEVPLDAQTVEVEYLTNLWTSNRIVFTYQ
jgi:predicted nucleic acid-binding Zn ribbon protein